VAHNEAMSQLRLTVSAVMAHLRLPARLFAELSPASSIEIEPDDAAAPVITFEVQGHTIARAYAKQHDGVFSATIFWTGCELSERRFDQWALAKESAIADASEDRDGNKRAE
jgi:hypothetical protein